LDHLRGIHSFIISNYHPHADFLEKIEEVERAELVQVYALIIQGWAGMT
jgi:hypothetical protein